MIASLEVISGKLLWLVGVLIPIVGVVTGFGEEWSLLEVGPWVMLLSKWVLLTSWLLLLLALVLLFPFLLSPAMLRLWPPLPLFVHPHRVLLHLWVFRFPRGMKQLLLHFFGRKHSRLLRWLQLHFLRLYRVWLVVRVHRPLVASDGRLAALEYVMEGWPRLLVVVLEHLLCG